MMKENERDALMHKVWPDWDEYWAMPAEQRHAVALASLNEARETIGAPPLDHIPTDQELQAEQAERDAAYQKQYNSFSARWNRFLDRLLGPA